MTWARAAALALACAAAGGAAACDTHPLDATTSSSATLLEGLLAHYTFDEGSGTVVVDHSLNRKDGVLSGGTWLPDGGRFGGALHFGGSDYVTVDTFPYPPKSFSVSMWVRSNDQPLDGLETLLSTEIVFEAGWEINLEKPDAGAPSVQSAFWSPSDGAYTHADCVCVPLGAWTHVVSVLDGDAQTLSLYVDGAFVASTPAHEPIVPGEPSLLIGKWSGTLRFLVGDIDDVAIYSRPLAPSEVAALYSQPPPDPR
jgi:hypothetical protein